MKSQLVISVLAIAVVISALGVVYTKHQSRKMFVELIPGRLTVELKTRLGKTWV
jgi:cell division protein FtsL